MLYVSIEFFFVYAKPLCWSCYAERDTHCMSAVIPIVLRPSYNHLYGVTKSGLKRTAKTV